MEDRQTISDDENAALNTLCDLIINSYLEKFEKEHESPIKMLYYNFWQYTARFGNIW